MKWNFLFLLVISLTISAGYSKENLVAIAIKEYAENNFVKNGKTFEIVYNSKNVSLVDETIKLLGGLAYRVTQVDTAQNFPFFFKKSAILIFDKFESFTNFARNLLRFASTNKTPHLLIVCPKLTTKEVLRGHSPGEYEFFPINQYLIEEKKQIYLKELTWYTPQACNKAQLIEINRFSKKKLKWTTKKFSNAKVDNFHGCTLKVCYVQSTFFENEYNWTTTKDGKVENIHTEGFLFNLAYELSRRLNFTMETWLCDVDIETDSPRYLNLTERKEYKDLPRCDWILHSLPIIKYSYEVLTTSKPIFTNAFTIIVPPGAFYSSEEKFILPFDELTWILLALVFASAFSVVFLVRLSRSNSIAEFVHGENVSTPGLNIVGAFMGIGQLSLPARNVARILLMNFVIFSLIMRTAYQGVYFQFLTTNPQKKPISSLEEIAKKHFPVYTDSGYRDVIFNIETNSFYFDYFDKLKVVFVTRKKLLSYTRKILKSSFEGCMLVPSKELEVVNKFSFKYLDNVKINNLRINLLTLNYAMSLHPLFDLKIVDSGFIESGILNNWKERIKYFDEVKLIRGMEKNLLKKSTNLVVLSMDHLATGFYIWLSALSLSVIVFIAELCNFSVKRIWIRLTRSNRISFAA